MLKGRALQLPSSCLPCLHTIEPAFPVFHANQQVLSSPTALATILESTLIRQRSHSAHHWHSPAIYTYIHLPPTQSFFCCASVITGTDNILQNYHAYITYRQLIMSSAAWGPAPLENEPTGAPNGILKVRHAVPTIRTEAPTGCKFLH